MKKLSKGNSKMSGDKEVVESTGICGLPANCYVSCNKQSEHTINKYKICIEDKADCCFFRSAVVKLVFEDKDYE